MLSVKGPNCYIMSSSRGDKKHSAGMSSTVNLYFVQRYFCSKSFHAPQTARTIWLTRDSTLRSEHLCFQHIKHQFPSSSTTTTTLPLPTQSSQTSLPNLKHQTSNPLLPPPLPLLLPHPPPQRHSPQHRQSQIPINPNIHRGRMMARQRPVRIRTITRRDVVEHRGQNCQFRVGFARS